MLAPAREPYAAARGRRGAFVGQSPSGTPRGGLRRARRVLLAAAGLCLIPAVVSYLQMLSQPSNSSLSIRSVEWMRDNGARGIVNQVESTYYALTAPSTGGPALRALPKQPGSAAAAPHHTLHDYRPPQIRPLISPALPGEGVWRATFADGGARAPVLVTDFRSDPAYPQMVAGVAWIDHTQTSTWLYPGRLEPSVPLPSRGPMEVPPSLRPGLVATFNSAFKLSDSGGGLVIDGHTFAPLRSGLATILRYRGGRIDVAAWTGGPNAGSDIVYARQNLPLIVNDGQPNPNLSDGPQWGATLGNAIRVWRSAVGVDRYGNLIYAAADYQTVASLAAIMIHTGAARAMELDINTYWPSFITYRYPGAGDPTNPLPTMDRSPQRYLTPDDRDFFAVYLR